MALTKPRVALCALMLFWGHIVAEDLPNNAEDRTARAVNFGFARHFQDHMVLQRAPQKANVYGFAPNIGQKVTLKFTTPSKVYNYQTTVTKGPDGVGTWNFLMDPMPAKTAGTLQVQSGGESKYVKDVIFGDVWICSGQSNMEMTVSMINGGDQEIADAHNYPDIRVVTVAKLQSDQPKQDLSWIDQNWARASSTSIGGNPWTHFSAVCWLYGKALYKNLGVPIGLVASVWGGTPVAAWSSHDALVKCNVPGADETDPSERKIDEPVDPESPIPAAPAPQANSVLWNAMMTPLLRMTIYGVIWYQGESDAWGEKMERYDCTFPKMIDDWRVKFNKASGRQTPASFPFGFVQLAPHKSDPTIYVGFPDIRFHQTGDYGYVPNPDMKNVFMAVAMDLPDFDSKYGPIHPQEKKTIGERLALAGLAVAYHKNVMYQGPFPQKITLVSDGVTIDYGSTWELDVKDWYGFEVKCPDGKWLPSNIKSSTKTTITLTGNICSNGKSPVGLRYEWRESPCKLKHCSVYEKVKQLPGPPFEYYPPT